MSVLDDPRDDSLRQRWCNLIERRMVRAAADRKWPLREAECFARVLLDAAAQRPINGVGKLNSYANVSAAILEDATALGEAVLEGSADIVALNRLSLQMRGNLRQSA